jgi:chaperonin cofactor prefoldin
VALVAGLAVGVLNFVYVKEKITTLQADLDRETKAHREFEGKYHTTDNQLKKTTAELKQTQATLEATTAAKEKAEADMQAAVKRADGLNTAQADLQAYKVTGVTPAQILGMNQDLKKLEDNLATVNAENKVFVGQIAKLKNRLAIYETPEAFVYLPANLKGKVLVADPKWNFVVLSVGEDQGVMERGELLVNRNGKLVAKVIVRSVQKDRCVANVMPGWELSEVMEGDQVIPAHPAS